MKQYEFEYLLKNIKDGVYESQVKLGYVEEVVRTYYMDASLRHLLGLNEQDRSNIAEILDAFEQYCIKAEEPIEVSSNEKGRYCFAVSKQLSKKVHETYRENTFLEKLVQRLQVMPCTIEDILKVFYIQSDQVVCEKCSGMEFDYVIYYKDPKIDEYKYCFTVHESHAYYHRFTDFDYQSIL